MQVYNHICIPWTLSQLVKLGFCLQGGKGQDSNGGTVCVRPLGLKCWSGQGEAWAFSTVINQGTGISLCSLGANLWSSSSLCAQRMKLIAKLTSKSSLLHIWDNPSWFCFSNSNIWEGRKTEGFQPLSNPVASPLSCRSVNSYMAWGLFAFISLCSMCPQPFTNRCFALWKGIEGGKVSMSTGERERERERVSMSKNAVCRCQSGLQSRSNLPVLQKEDTWIF